MGSVLQSSGRDAVLSLCCGIERDHVLAVFDRHPLRPRGRMILFGLRYRLAASLHQPTDRRAADSERDDPDQQDRQRPTEAGGSLVPAHQGASVLGRRGFRSRT